MIWQKERVGVGSEKQDDRKRRSSHSRRLYCWLTLFLSESDSWKKKEVKMRLMRDKIRARTAGRRKKVVPFSEESWLEDKAAPIIGPTINPTEKAIPIIAMPFPLSLWVETSETIAVERLTFPLDIPPRVRDKQNNRKDPRDWVQTK